MPGPAAAARTRTTFSWAASAAPPMTHPPSPSATTAGDPPTMTVRYHGPRYTPAGRTVDDAPAGGRRARAGRARVGGARGARADHDRPAGRGDDDGSRPQHAGADRQLLRQPLRHAHAVGRRAPPPARARDVVAGRRRHAPGAPPPPGGEVPRRLPAH